jgi:hypothetical protein
MFVLNVVSIRWTNSSSIGQVAVKSVLVCTADQSNGVKVKKAKVSDFQCNTLITTNIEVSNSKGLSVNLTYG